MRAALLAVLALLAAHWAAPAAAEEIRLDEARRAALAELPPLVRRQLGDRDLAGQVVVVGFFASWCPPRWPEFQTLNEIHREFAQEGVTVLAVNIFEDHFKKDLEDRRAAFLISTAPLFAVVGEGERIADAFGPVTRIPTTFVFARDGRPVLHFIHARGATKTHASLEELRAAVQSAL